MNELCAKLIKKIKISNYHKKLKLLVIQKKLSDSPKHEYKQTIVSFQ